MPESLDLAALREAIGRFELKEIFGTRDSQRWVSYVAIEDRDLIVRETRAVLALVDEQRERISTLEEALRQIEAEAGGTERWYRTRAYLTLVGFQAEKEQTDA